MDSKNCKKCGVELIVGNNWYECRAKKSTFICSSCLNNSVKEWRRSNPKRALIQRSKNRAKTEGLPFEITEGDFEIPEVCPVLGIPIFQGTGVYTDNSPSLDKFDPKLGYVVGNIAVISMKANRIKNSSTIEEVRQLLNWMESVCGQ